MRLINAKDLINPKRLDLIVKYLYAKEFLESENNYYSTGVYKDLYIRHILMRNMGIEPQREYEKNDKTSVDKFCFDFEKLILDIKNNGYDESRPVFVNNLGLPENGAHRISVLALLNKEIPVVKSKLGWEWDFNWFSNNGFNTDDKQRILKGFVDIHSDKCAIFVVWNPLFKYIDNVKAVINNYFDIVGDVELDFENNYIAFTNALLEIYEPNISQSGDDTVIREKAKLLQANYLSFKVIVVTNQNKNTDKTISELSKICKDEIRNLFNHILPKECFCTVHSSDGKDECNYLASILLSPNNIKHLKMRISTNYDNKFLIRIRELKHTIQNLNIKSINDICVIRSGVLTALGILKDTDLDFIIKSQYRKLFGNGDIHLNNVSCDIASLYDIEAHKIDENKIIECDDYHFYAKGIKFANLNIVKEQKKLFKKKNDKYHLRQIDLFEKMIGNFNQQKMLMDRVEAERQRRLELQKTKIIDTKVNYSNIFERILSFKNEYSNNKKYKVITLFNVRIKLRGKHAR